MDALDYLKKQAKSVLKDKEQATGKHESLDEFHHSEIVNCLDRVHHYLIELMEQLRIVSPDIKTDFEIEKLGTLHELVQKNYRLYTENTFSNLTIGLGFILFCEQEHCKISTSSPEDADKLHNKLRHLGIEINGHIVGEPEIKGYVSSSLLFRSDYQRQLINLTINNVENSVVHTYELDPENINNTLLNELGNYLLRKENNFINLIKQQESRSAHIKSIKELDEAEPTLTEMMNTSLANSLFKGKQQLYLTYHEKIKELDSRGAGLVVGRSTKCAFIIDSDCASRQHAKLSYRKGKFVVSDHSTNGTFIKPQGGKEVYIHGEDYPLSGSGFISLGESISVDNEHLIYYSCQ
ncbi:MAG: FHA domain-containing protein [Gammaproteobacteria bacterium]|nr:FHA domain-containing protein [Gammaproteobacteria bacterium]